MTIISPSDRLWDLVTELLGCGMKVADVEEVVAEAIQYHEAEKAKKK
jgi:hypothetical protein